MKEQANKKNVFWMHTHRVDKEQHHRESFVVYSLCLQWIIFYGVSTAWFKDSIWFDAPNQTQVCVND